MATPHRPLTARERAREHRERLRKMGLRPVQFWLPDVRSREFIEEARRQAKAAASSKHAEEDQAFIDSISVGLNEEG